MLIEIKQSKTLDDILEEVIFIPILRVILIILMEI